MPKLYRILLTLSCLVCTALPAQSWAASAAEKYASCTEKVRTDPKSAIAYANSWDKVGSNPSALHCKALALYAIKDYAEAAGILEQISEPLKRSNLTLWQDIIQQIARSWRYAGQMHRAIATLNRAINETSSRAFSDNTYANATLKLLKTRAEYYQNNKQPLAALQDYDNALAIDANAHTIRLQRATLLKKLGEARLAADDARYIISATPANNATHQAAKKLVK